MDVGRESWCSFRQKKAPESGSGVDGEWRSRAGLNVELDLWTLGQRPCRFGASALPPKSSRHLTIQVEPTAAQPWDNI